MPGARALNTKGPDGERPLPHARVHPAGRGALRRLWPVIPLLLVCGLFTVRSCTAVDQRDRLRSVAVEPIDPPGASAWTGVIHVERGGPVILGFQSDRPARLSVLGRDLRGQGVIKERFVVPAGPLAVRFAATPDAQLIWSPVGRRGDPEYVAPGVLEGAGNTRITDGVIALLLLLTIIGSALALARRRLATVPRSTWLAMGAVFAVAVIVRWFDLDGFGQAWDEDVNWSAGRNYITNVLALDFRERAWLWNYEHPPVMKYLAGIGAQFADGFGPARALSAICIALGCALLVPIGRRLYSLRVGVLAAAIAALLPPLVAHGQIVGHEAPTVLWWSLGILMSLGVHDGIEIIDARRLARRTLWLRLAAVGAVIGIAVASRFVNGLLGPLCVLIVIVTAPPAWRTHTLLSTPIMVATTVLTFVAVWPRMWFHPIANLSASLKKLDVQHAAEPFLGTITNAPPPYYFVVYLVATLPVGILLAVLAGLVRTALERNRSSLLVLAWLAIPLLIAASPVRQDGVRYVMPCLTALAMIAALGIDFVATKLRRSRAFEALAVIVVLYLGVTLVRVHPYYLDYYGEHVGGARAAQQAKRFETAWWGEGIDRAVDYVNEHAAPNAKVHRDCILPAHLAWFREDLWAPMVRDPRQADWIVVYVSTVHRCPVPPDARKVYEVTASGATLAVVYQRP